MNTTAVVPVGLTSADSGFSVRAKLRAKFIPWASNVVDTQRRGTQLIEIICAQSNPRVAAGDVIALHVAGACGGPLGTWRRYTVAGADLTTFRVVGHLASTGPGSVLLGRCVAGDSLVWRGPERGITLEPGTRWLLIGDESAVGAIEALLGPAHEHGGTTANAFVVTENDHGNEAVGLSANGSLTEACNWLDQNHRQTSGKPIMTGVAVIGSHALIQTVADHVKLIGISTIRRRVYWRAGRKGME